MDIEPGSQSRAFDDEAGTSSHSDPAAPSKTNLEIMEEEGRRIVAEINAQMRNERGSAVPFGRFTSLLNGD